MSCFTLRIIIILMEGEPMGLSDWIVIFAIITSVGFAGMFYEVEPASSTTETERSQRLSLHHWLEGQRGRQITTARAWFVRFDVSAPLRPSGHHSRCGNAYSPKTSQWAWEADFKTTNSLKLLALPRGLRKLRRHK